MSAEIYINKYENAECNVIMQNSMLPCENILHIFRPGFRESAFQPIPKQETQDDKSTLQIKKQGKNLLHRELIISKTPKLESQII